jgi:hypothetical protein
MVSRLSSPTIATSSGTRTPPSRSVSATPPTIWSLPQKNASVPGTVRRWSDP